MNSIEIMTIENFHDHKQPTIPVVSLTEDKPATEKSGGLVVSIKKDKVCVGQNEVNRSKIGSFLQMINNVAMGMNNNNVQLSAIGSNIPLKMQF